MSTQDPRTEDSLATGRQRLNAAALLRRNHYYGDALILATDAVRLLVDAATDVRLPTGAVLSTDAALGALARDTDAEALDELLRAGMDLERRITRLARRPRRRARTFALLVLPLAAGLGVVWLVGQRDPPPGTVTASSVFTGDWERWGPRKALDGDPATEWMLQDLRAGSMDVYLEQPRDVHGVVLINGRNAPHMDRAVRDYRVLLFSGTDVVARTTGRLPPVGEGPTEVELSLDGRHVTRVRFEALGYYVSGASLAELQLR